MRIFIRDSVYLTAGGAIVALAIWAASSFAAPHYNEPRLTAKPAPAAPYLHEQWRDDPPTNRRVLETKLQKKDSLAALLKRNNINANAAQSAITALAKIYNPRRLPSGAQIRLYEVAGEQKHFDGLDFLANPRERIIVRRVSADDFTAIKHTRTLHDRRFFVDTLITRNLYEAARGNGISANIVADLIRLFSFTIDFQRDIREGDRLEVFYTRHFDDDGSPAQEGDIIFAAITNRGSRQAFWRMTHDDGRQGFYDENGNSVQRLLMSTPVDGARLSSSYGMRRHPISGYTRLHRGLDFAAPIGTPVYAAGDGEVVIAAARGSFGKYIRLKHSNGFETAYAHLNGYARELRVGAKVKQGQTIGYVGKTGRVTGAHLHYEVLRSGKTINPKTITQPAATKLSKSEIARLNATRAEASRHINLLSASTNATNQRPFGAVQDFTRGTKGFAAN